MPLTTPGPDHPVRRFTAWMTAAPRVWVVGLLTLLCMLMSVVITGLLFKLLIPEPRFLPLALVMGAIVPLLVAGPVLAAIVHLLHEVGRARAEAQRLASRDALTGALNRRHFLELAERELAIARRTGAPVSVLLIDLDDFKRINDLHGHATGDAVLCRLVDAASATLRTTDLLARWGGEEFVVMMPATGPEGAAEVAERLLGRIAASQAGAAHAPATVTASIGLASEAPPPSAAKGWQGLSLQALIDRADQAMYRAKREGKARVVQG